MVLQPERGSIELVLLVVHSAGLWQFLQPLSNKDGSVGVAQSVGQALHFTLCLLFAWKKKSEEW